MPHPTKPPATPTVFSDAELGACLEAQALIQEILEPLEHVLATLALVGRLLEPHALRWSRALEAWGEDAGELRPFPLPYEIVGAVTCDVIGDEMLQRLRTAARLTQQDLDARWTRARNVLARLHAIQRTQNRLLNLFNGSPADEADEANDHHSVLGEIATVAASVDLHQVEARTQQALEKLCTIVKRLEDAGRLTATSATALLEGLHPNDSP